MKSHKAKPLPVDNGLVVGCRPLEGSGRKLCGLEDMDEDDKLIYYLKLAKWTERDIHNKLVSESRIDYHIKTIGTRFSRMRKYIMADNDERLKQGTIAWLEAEVSLYRHPLGMRFAMLNCRLSEENITPSSRCCH